MGYYYNDNGERLYSSEGYQTERLVIPKGIGKTKFDAPNNIRLKMPNGGYGFAVVNPGDQIISYRDNSTLNGDLRKMPEGTIVVFLRKAGDPDDPRNIWVRDGDEEVLVTSIHYEQYKCRL